ncbi:hypothetical protein NQ315_008027 [Exocentrus adspersus]|uniref:Uncharacterized protein n=1 Tax=Exocentrus adspersus TaxID=1586481 RepID=A0AAV8VVW0_9CUCU|nr:hypothetical protein NQ315_008027 [Exocentrus adspersus]
MLGQIAGRRQLSLHPVKRRCYGCLGQRLELRSSPKNDSQRGNFSSLETICHRLPTEVTEEKRIRELGATVILNTTDYINKIEDLLSDPAYQKLLSNPLRKLEREVAAAIRSSNIPGNLHRELSRTSQLYGLSKIHKPDVPLRPTVSAVGSATHLLTRYISKEIQDLVGNTEHRIKNSTLYKGIYLQPADILLTRVCTRSTYFAFAGQFHKKKEGAAMLLFGWLTSRYKEAFERKAALDSAPLNPKCWFRYPYGRDTVKEFLHLNGMHRDIKFTIGLEKDGTPPFLDVLVNRGSDDTLERRVYRKPTHTDRYLNAVSHHHPAQKQGVIDSPGTISEQPSVATESSRNIEREIKRRPIPREKQEFVATTYLPYVKGCTDRIARLLVLRKRNINIVSTTMKKIASKAYIGQTGRHKSAVAERRADTGHTTELERWKVFARDRRFWPRLYKDSIEIQKNPNNYNRDEPGIWKRYFCGIFVFYMGSLAVITY